LRVMVNGGVVLLVLLRVSVLVAGTGYVA